MSLAPLRLFKAFPVEDRIMALGTTQHADALRRTIPKGFIFAPEVLAAYPNYNDLIAAVDGLYGADPEALNKSFHKSFSKVRDASLRQLYVEQMIHYASTYGARAWGTYKADRVYIPVEALDVPSIDVKEFPFVLIRGLTPAELKTALLDLLSSGVALSEQSVKDCLEVASLPGVILSDDEIESIKNREVKIGLYELYGKVPANPVEFLRYVVYRTTGDTLLIKSGGAVARLKAGVTTHSVLPLFNRYINEHGIDRLGEIFLRFKPLFLALRADATLRPTINKIRRAAESNHKPLAPDYLNSVTALIKRSGDFGGPKGVVLSQLQAELDDPKVNVFRKIRLAQALRVRTAPDLDSIVYKIRNGKSYATELPRLSSQQVNDYLATYEVVLSNIAQTLAPSLAGRRIFIPEGVVYGLPATEKQFVGNFPAGSYIEAPRGQALVAGIYWENQGRASIDLDLAAANNSGKIGWDGSYRSQGQGVLFSGDITDARNGATEVFWFDPSCVGSWLVSVNYYNYSRIDAPYKIVVGTGDATDINKNFVFDSNRVLLTATDTLTAEDRQHNLGMVVGKPSFKLTKDNAPLRFYLGMANLGGGATSRHNVNAERARKFMEASLYSAPTLNEVLYLSRATLVDSAEQADEGYDLSPSVVDKTSILSLLSA